MDLISRAIRLKYQLIRYYYSQFAHINQKGGSFFRPLFFDWASDALAYEEIHKNIVLGNALKVSILSEDGTGKPTTSYYFPNGRWCQIYPTRSNDPKFCFDAPEAGV
jgi:alpha-glucosidase (family GH31 glycosyl hydrolase)